MYVSIFYFDSAILSNSLPSYSIQDLERSFSPHPTMATPASKEFKDLQEDATSDRTIIIGGGIVGSVLAYFLSATKIPASQIILLDASLTQPQGSTAFAPGFVGQLNTLKSLTEMAKESVAHYAKIPGETWSSFSSPSVRI